jgi:hypothetical protein
VWGVSYKGGGRDVRIGRDWGGEGGRDGGDGVRRGIGVEGTDRFDEEGVVLVFLRGPCAITVGGLEVMFWQG